MMLLAIVLAYKFDSKRKKNNSLLLGFFQYHSLNLKLESYTLSSKNDFYHILEIDLLTLKL